MKQVTFILVALSLSLFAAAQPGTIDETFNSSGTPGSVTTNLVNGGDDYGRAMATYSDGRIAVAAYNENNYFTILRYTAAGTLDASFGTGGVVTLRYAPGDDAQAYAVTVLPNNKVLVAGYSWGSTKDFALLCLDENGDPDPGFGTGGWAITPVGAGDDEARSITVQSDHKIVVAGLTSNGSNTDVAVVRYNSDGSLDSFFGTGGIVTTDINGNDVPAGVVVQGDGKIVVAATSNTAGASDFAAIRYNGDGSLDTFFGSGGIVTVDVALGGPGSTDVAHCVALQPDGKIVLAGQTQASSGGNDDVAIIRLTTAGALDAGPSGFDGDGIVTYNYGVVNTDEEVQSISIQNDGRILLAGSTDGAGSSYSLLLLAYSPDCSLDPTFGPGANGIATADLTSTYDVGYAMALDGSRIYVAGWTGDVSDKQIVLAAFENNYITLPLTLVTFYAEKQQSKVVLHWQTASEEGVQQFIIEASTDGKTFSAIGHVTATGSPNSLTNYSFTDRFPHSGNNLYRLRMEDMDGKRKYSNVVNVSFLENLSSPIRVYPSPAREVLHVQLPEGLRGAVSLRIIDVQGRVVKSSSIISRGNALSTSFNIGSLPGGMYILEAQAGLVSLTSRFIKQ